MAGEAGKGWKEWLDWHGRTGRRAYAVTGFVLSAVKFNIDRLLAAYYGHAWSPWNYIVPSETFSLSNLPPEQRGMYLALAAIALPFLLVGILLTIRRLRDAALSPLWCLLFFVPVVNLFFFALLCILPPRDEDAVAAAHRLLETPKDGQPAAAPAPAEPQPDEPRFHPVARFLYRIMPESMWGSAFVSVLASAVVGVPLAVTGPQGFQNYGWGLFIGAPFCLGLVSAMVFGIRARRTGGQCCNVGMAALFLVILGLLCFKFEGVICLVMALPIALPVTLLGSLIGASIQEKFPWTDPDGPNVTSRMTGIVLFLLPLLMGVEKVFALSPILIPVHTSVIVNAPPEHVWPNVVTFSELPPLDFGVPQDWIFATGIAYPKKARIEGRGVGAVRYCEFSTGPFVEPITTWQEPTLLAFSVRSQPEPMHELSPYPDVHPPHLDNFIVSRRGQFALTRLPDGRTLLEGTTWYQNRMWPQRYWQIWSDFLIHRIHTRVLNHVKACSEAAR